MDETELAELKAMAISQHIPAGEMTRAHFIALHMDRFARRGKRRNICGVISIDNVNLWRLPKESDQRHGKLTRPPEEILGDIHRSEVFCRLSMEVSGTLPFSTPIQRWASAHPVPLHIVREYPDLMEKFRRGM